MINICPNLVKASLALGVKKPDLKFASINNLNLAKKPDYTIFLNLANFAWELAWDLFTSFTLLLPPTLSIVFSLSIIIRFFTKSSILVILIIKINGIAI